jgi:hypothetical protein
MLATIDASLPAGISGTVQFALTINSTTHRTNGSSCQGAALPRAGGQQPGMSARCSDETIDSNARLFYNY